MNYSMNENFMASLRQATWLTKGGQLQEATALIQRALQGEPMPKTTDSAPAKGEIFEGNFSVVEEPSGTSPNPSARHKAARPDPATTSQKPFATTPNTSGLDELLRSKLSGLSGLHKGADSYSDLLTGGATSFPAGSGMSDLLRGKLSGLNITVDAPAQVLPEGATFNSGTFANQSGRRDYKLYVPSDYHGQPLPLIVMLHGCTQNPDDFAAGTGMNQLAEEQPCLVLYPAQHTGANHSRCWNWFKADDQRREGGEPAIIAGMTRQIIKEYHVDEQRVYVAGLSAGGAMASTMAMTYPEIYAAVGVHSGLAHGSAQDLPSALAAMQGGTGPMAGLNQQMKTRSTMPTTSHVPAIIFHGDQDATVHPSNSDRVAAQHLASDPTSNSKLEVQQHSGKVPNGRSYNCTVHSDASGQPILEQWSIHGAAHAWAGGNSQGSYTDPQGPDASREMLRFFLSHPKGEVV